MLMDPEVCHLRQRWRGPSCGCNRLRKEPQESGPLKTQHDGPMQEASRRAAQWRARNFHAPASCGRRADERRTIQETEL